MTEFQFIARLTGELPTNDTVVAGPGDDCAVLDLGLPGRWILFKTDAVVEGVHFTRETDPRKVGWKAMGRCLSDLAAMGGEPGSAVVTLALPSERGLEFAEPLYAGMNSLAARHGVVIVGGETVRHPERVMISVAMIGTVERDRCLLRSGAQAGDALFVTGELGGSLAGKHLEFEPRVQEARWLSGHFPVRAMIDLSDGLAGDLRHVLEAGQVGAELRANSIPISKAARAAARNGSSKKTPLLAALTDGEDFELLFALPSNRAVELLDGWKAQFPGTRLTCIGKVTAELGLKIRDKTGQRELGDHAYDHFEER